MALDGQPFGEKRSIWSGLYRGVCHFLCTEVGTKCPGRQNAQPEISDNIHRVEKLSHNYERELGGGPLNDLHVHGHFAQIAAQKVGEMPTLRLRKACKMRS